ncbi:MAG: RtcB family protein [Acidobacteriota bacterium]
MKKNLIKINDYKWVIPKETNPLMKVPGVIFASEELVQKALEDQSLVQVINAASLPGIVKASIAMPDIHFGYGLPIGGVVATDWENGVISPGGVGFDINCGVRLIRTNFFLKDIKDKERAIVDTLYQKIPTGVGSRGALKLSFNELKEVLKKGAKWAVERGYGDKEDLNSTESLGTLEGADPEKVSSKALDRGKDQLGTLGSGNHFLEVQYVEEIYDPHIAKILGLEKDLITVMIHTGSRGLGHQIATDYLAILGGALKKWGINVPDRQLACAPIQSKEGMNYIEAMKGAANFAWANRQIIMHWAEEALLRALNISRPSLGMKLIYDIAHNIVKKEEHIVEGKKMTVAVHRKGATRAFPPFHPEVPIIYREIGQPVIIPGDMGRYSYLLVGEEKAMEESFGSSCHGAGRVLSRHQAMKRAQGRSISKELEQDGILVRASDRETLVEEMSEAYKDVSLVVESIEKASISKKVVRMRPITVIKG